MGLIYGALGGGFRRAVRHEQVDVWIGVVGKATETGKGETVRVKP